MHFQLAHVLGFFVLLIFIYTQDEFKVTNLIKTGSNIFKCSKRLRKCIIIKHSQFKY